MTEFADHPISLAERRAEASGKAKDWTPRDALIALLRDIDSGEDKVDALVICYRVREGDDVKTHFNMATASAIEGLGLLSRVAWMINES